MISLTILYNEYTDRRKLTEHKKHIWVYISSPTSAKALKIGLVFTLF